MTTTILAWHGDPDLKAEVIARLRQHRAEDSIVQGLYQEFDPDLASGYRGCAIGCTLPKQPAAPCGCGVSGCVRDPSPEDGWHFEVEKRYGIRTSVGCAIDNLFEQLPAAEAGDFAVAVVEAIPVGADLTDIRTRYSEARSICLATLTDESRWAAARFIEDLRNAPVPAVTS